MTPITEMTQLDELAISRAFEELGSIEGLDDEILEEDPVCLELARMRHALASINEWELSDSDFDALVATVQLASNIISLAHRLMDQALAATNTYDDRPDDPDDIDDY